MLTNGVMSQQRSDNRNHEDTAALYAFITRQSPAVNESPTKTIMK